MLQGATDLRIRKIFHNRLAKVINAAGNLEEFLISYLETGLLFDENEPNVAKSVRSLRYPFH